MYARISGAYDWINAQICSLSENPPAECGSTVPPGQRRVRVDVQYGENPNLVEWDVECDKDLVASSAAGSVTRALLTSDFFDVEPSECRFTSRNLEDGSGKCSNSNGRSNEPWLFACSPLGGCDR